MTDVRGARIVRLAQDPALSGDLLLLGMCLAAIWDFGLRYEGGFGGIGKMLWPDWPNPGQRALSVFKRDMRTYRSPISHRCSAPMPRRGGVCGRSTATRTTITEWSTGEWTSIGACSRHLAWFGERRRENAAAKPDIVPLPYANAGGDLAKHFPRIDWPKFWRQLDPKWVEHPERTARPKPDLALVIGEGAKEGRRGSLTLVPSGGAW